MTFLDKLEQIDRVDSLIRRKSTGTPLSLSMKLETSERYVYKLINLMKNLGAPIYYCKYYESYCYKDEVLFTFGFEIKHSY